MRPKSKLKQTGTNLNDGRVLPNWITFWPIWKRCRLKLNAIWRRWMFWSLKLNHENSRFTQITRTWMTYNEFARYFDEIGRENLYFKAIKKALYWRETRCACPLTVNYQIAVFTGLQQSFFLYRRVVKWFMKHLANKL